MSGAEALGRQCTQTCYCACLAATKGLQGQLPKYMLSGDRAEPYHLLQSNRNAVEEAVASTACLTSSDGTRRAVKHEEVVAHKLLQLYRRRNNLQGPKVGKGCSSHIMALRNCSPGKLAECRMLYWHDGCGCRSRGSDACATPLG